MAPACTPWSSIQQFNIAKQGDAFRAHNEDWRDQDEKGFLQFCRQTYDLQQSQRRHGHIEGPWAAASWQRQAFADMSGFDAKLDQCRFVAEVLGATGSFVGLSRKTIRTRITWEESALAMSLRCLWQSERAHLSGRQLGEAHNYPWPVAGQIAYLLTSTMQLVDHVKYDPEGFEILFVIEDQQAQPVESETAHHQRMQMH